MNSMTPTNTVLNNGITMPAIGFGVYQTPPDETAVAVTTALDVGYRHIDNPVAWRTKSRSGSRANGVLSTG